MSDLVITPTWAVRDRSAIVAWVDPDRPDRSDGTIVALDGRMVLHRRAGTLIHDSTRVTLRPDELVVLEMLLLKAGSPCPSHELSRALWGQAAPHGASSLRVVVHRLRARIREGAEHLATVRGIGYMWQE